MACLGKYLKGTGIDKVLVDTEMYGLISIETVLNGGHYAGANRVYSLIAEILNVLQLDTFFTENDKMHLECCSSPRLASDMINLLIVSFVCKSFFRIGK